MITRKSQNDKTGPTIGKKTRHGKRIFDIGTWNVRGLRGKEAELVEEMKKINLKLLAVTETKRKGHGCVKIHDNYTLFFSGVPSRQQAQCGVGFIVHPELEDKIQDWRFINERLMNLTWNINGQKQSIFVAYAPNDSASSSEKDDFFDTLQNHLDQAEGKPWILGDLNGRVGRRPSPVHPVIGRHGEDEVNNSGERIIHLCVANDLVVTNTWFPHRRIHTITREEPGRNEASIIDYILVPRAHFKFVRDARVLRGPELGTDHYLLRMKFDAPRRGFIKKKTTKWRIKNGKMKEPETKAEFKRLVSLKCEQAREHLSSPDVETVWTAFKKVILESAEEACGQSRVGGPKKATRWWTEDVKMKVKEKKVAWRLYMSHRTPDNYAIYKEKRRAAKIAIEEAKRKSWDEFGSFMEDSFRDNKKLFFKALKNMRKEKECPIKRIKDQRGNVLYESKKIMARWKEHFRDLLEGRDLNDTAGARPQTQTLYSTPTIPCVVSLPVNQEDYITKNELVEALGKMKLGKAAGVDGITPEMLKFIGPPGEGALLHLVNQCYQSKVVPREWGTSVIVPIYKKGDNRDCGNHRGISLLSVPGKLYARILEGRLRTIVESQLEDSQCGFRPGKGTQDLIFIARQLSEKAVEVGRNLHLAFIDLEKAFDRVPREEIWQALDERGINPSLTNAIKSLYTTCLNKVRTGNEESDLFITTKGVRQGCCLSPLLFIILMDVIIKRCSTRVRKFCLGYFKLQPVYLTELAFADDVAIISGSVRDLQFNLEIWREELERLNMKISVSKTKTMVISGDEITKHNVFLGREKLEQVEAFKYLGCHLAQNGKMRHELDSRIAAAGKLFQIINKGFLSQSTVSKRTKLAVYNSVYVPTLTYGHESWVLTQTARSRVQAMEMRFLRKIEGKTRRDRVRNHTIRSKLGIEPLQERIEKGQLRWFGHMERMPEESAAKKVYCAKATGRRRRGRPRKKWIDDVAEAVASRGKTLAEAKRLSADRKDWKSFCKSSTL